MKTIISSLMENLKESADNLTLAEVTNKLYDGEIDIDVCDKDIDMEVAFCYSTKEPIKDEYEKFIKKLADNVRVLKSVNNQYGGLLVCDFSSYFKPYNEEWKKLFNMNNSEFDEDEAYYEAVVNLEPLISGNAGESFYKEVNNVLDGKTVNTEEAEITPYVNNNLDDFGNWFEDNVDLLVDNFEAIYHEEPVAKSGITNDKWDMFTADEYEKEKNKSEMNESLKESTEVSEIVDEAARYIFEDLSIDYLPSEVPDYDTFNDYTMEISKSDFNKALKLAEKAASIRDEHNYYDDNSGNGNLLELNDNHTIWELTNENKTDEDWWSTVDSKIAAFKAETGVDLYLVGRMSRHACVEPTYDNCLNYDKLKEVQEKLEQEAIDEFNNEELKESLTESTKLYTCLDCDNEFEIEDDKGWTYGEGNCPHCLSGDISLDIEEFNYNECPEDVKNAVYSFLYKLYSEDETKVKDSLNKVTINYEELENNLLGKIYIDLDGKTYKVDIDGEILNENPDLNREQVNAKLTESVDEGSLSKFIKDSVEKLQTTNYTNCKYNLDDTLALFVGWSNGYDSDDDSVIHSKDEPNYGINAGIRVRNDALWTDFDYLSAPYYEDGEVYETTVTISPNYTDSDYDNLANMYIKDYYVIKDLIHSGELLTESDNNYSSIPDKLYRIMDAELVKETELSSKIRANDKNEICTTGSLEFVTKYDNPTKAYIVIDTNKVSEPIRKRNSDEPDYVEYEDEYIIQAKDSISNDCVIEYVYNDKLKTDKDNIIVQATLDKIKAVEEMYNAKNLDESDSKIDYKRIADLFFEGEINDITTELNGFIDNIMNDDKNNPEFPELNFIREYNLDDEGYKKIRDYLYNEWKKRNNINESTTQYNSVMIDTDEFGPMPICYNLNKPMTAKEIVNYIKNSDYNLDKIGQEVSEKELKDVVYRCNLELNESTNFDLPEGYSQEVYDKYFEYTKDIDLTKDEPLDFNEWYNKIYNEPVEEIQVDFSEFPREVEKGKTPEERKNIFYRCYVANPKKEEMNRWSVEDIVNYIKETDEYYKEDLQYIIDCCKLCGLSNEEMDRICSLNTIKEFVEETKYTINKKYYSNNSLEYCDYGLKNLEGETVIFNSEKEAKDYLKEKGYKNKSYKEDGFNFKEVYEIVEYKSSLDESINKEAKSIKIGNYNLYLTLGEYQNNGRTYIGLITNTREFGGEPYADVTINIPDYMLEDDNEVIINGDLGNDTLKKLENLGILTDTGKLAQSGFGRYRVMVFNKDKANKYIIENLNESESRELYIYSNAESEDKSDAESFADNYSKEFPNLNFRISSDGTMYFVDFIGKYKDICDALIQLGWYNEKEINDLTNNNMIKPYKED